MVLEMVVVFDAGQSISRVQTLEGALSKLPFVLLRSIDYDLDILHYFPSSPSINFHLFTASWFEQRGRPRVRPLFCFPFNDGYRLSQRMKSYEGCEIL
jgi:hypothetical protein